MKHVQDSHDTQPSCLKVRASRMDNDLVVLAYMQLAVQNLANGVPAPRILAMGCGDLSEWETLRILTRRRDFDITVIDNDEMQLEHLKSFITDFKITAFKRTIAETMRTNMFNSKFDLIYTNNVMEKMDDVFAGPFMKSIFRLLLPNGKFIGSNKMPGHEDNHMKTDLNWPCVLRGETALNHLARMVAPEAPTRIHIDTNRKKIFLEMQNV